MNWHTEPFHLIIPIIFKSNENLDNNFNRNALYLTILCETPTIDLHFLTLFSFVKYKIEQLIVSKQQQ
jgi:hypothetical protein